MAMLVLQHSILIPALLSLCYGQSLAPVAIRSQLSSTGVGQLSIENTGVKTITALVIVTPSATQPTGSKYRSVRATMYDAATEPLSATLIPPHNSRTIHLPTQLGRTESPERQSDLAVTAIFFADGSTWGDAYWLQKIADHRRNMMNSLVAAIEDLNNALEAGATREALREQFEAAQKREQGEAPNADALACIASTRGLFLRNLGLASGSDLPGHSLRAVIERQLESFYKRVSSLSTNSTGPVPVPQ